MDSPRRCPGRGNSRDCHRARRHQRRIETFADPAHVNALHNPRDDLAGDHDPPSRDDSDDFAAAYDEPAPDVTSPDVTSPDHNRRDVTSHDLIG